MLSRLPVAESQKIWGTGMVLTSGSVAGGPRAPHCDVVRAGPGKSWPVAVARDPPAHPSGSEPEGGDQPAMALQRNRTSKICNLLIYM